MILTTEKKSRLIADLMLLLTTLCWAISFPVGKMAMGEWGNYKFFFLASRFWLVAIVFTTWAVTRYSWRQFLAHIKPAFVTGMILVIVFGFQFSAYYSNPASKVALIMALSSVMVPLGLLIFFQKRILTGIWIGLIVATIGAILVNYGSPSTVGIAELFSLISAAAVAAYIIMLSYFLKQKVAVPANEKEIEQLPGKESLGAKAAGVKATSKAKEKSKYDKPLFLTIQFIFIAVATSILSLIFEISVSSFPSWSGKTVFAIIFMAIVATAIAISLQTVYQTKTTPERAALVFTLESPFAALFAYLILDEILTSTVIVGGVLIFLGVALAEILTAREERLQAENSLLFEDQQLETSSGTGADLTKNAPGEISSDAEKDGENGSKDLDGSLAHKLSPASSKSMAVKQSSTSQFLKRE